MKFIVYFFAFMPLSGIAQDTLTLVFVGDIMQHKNQIDAARHDSEYDYSSYFSHVQQYIKEADVAIANLEVTLAGKPYSGYPQFSAPDELAAALQAAGFNILLTANNHSCDKGKIGVERTINMLDSLGMAHTGTFLTQAARDTLYPMIWEKNGFRLAILNYTYGTNGIPTPSPTVVNCIDTMQIAADITVAADMKPDIIIANMHWGEEYKLYPSATQIKLADFLIRHGVRLVIGSHPHVLQRMECRYAPDNSVSGIIVYSLGNYISNMTAKNTDGGVMAHIRLIKNNGNAVIDECSYRLVWTHKPMINGQKKFSVLPVAAFEDKPYYFTRYEEYKAMTNFAKNMRELYNKETIGFKEIK